MICKPQRRSKRPNGGVWNPKLALNNPKLGLFNTTYIFLVFTKYIKTAIGINKIPIKINRD